jgi:hypothetical protein
MAHWVLVDHPPASALLGEEPRGLKGPKTRRPANYDARPIMRCPHAGQLGWGQRMGWLTSQEGGSPLESGAVGVGYRGHVLHS